MESGWGMIAVGLLLVALGVSNRKGNINSLHRYHRHRVAQEDILPFGKRVGLGTILAGAAVAVAGVFALAAQQLQLPVLETAGSVLVVPGLAVGLGISLHAIIKYNKGLF